MFVPLPVNMEKNVIKPALENKLKLNLIILVVNAQEPMMEGNSKILTV